MKAFQHQILR